MASNRYMDNNTGVGFQCLLNMDQATNANTFNTAVGWQTGYELTTGTSDTLIGADSGRNITTGSNNTAIGVDALIGISGNKTTGNNNTGLGFRAGQNIQGAAEDNTLVGANAGSAITTGNDNTVIGHTACDTTLTNGSGNTIIGTNTDTSASGGSNQIVIGSNVDGGGDSTARLGTSSGSATLNIDGSDTSWAAASDERLKKDIADCSVGLNFVKELRPVTYKWNAKNADGS